MNQDTIKDRVRGSIIGGAIGDAMGYQIELKVAEERENSPEIDNNTTTEV